MPLTPSRLLLLLLASSCVSSPWRGWAAGDSDAVRDASEAYAHAWLRGDADSVLATFVPEPVLSPSGMEFREGAAAARAFWWPEGGPPTRVTRFDTEVLEVDGAGDLGFVRGTFVLEFEYAGEEYSNRGKYLHLLRRGRDGAWRISHHLWDDLASTTTSAGSEAAAIETLVAPETLEMERYGPLADELDPVRFAEGYPAVMRRLVSDEQGDRVAAMRTIHGSGELDALPVVVHRMRTSEFHAERTWAGAAFGELVATHELKRRDPARPTGVHLSPRPEGHVDLRPLSWVVEELLAGGAESAATGTVAEVIGYVQLEEFRDELEAARISHPGDHWVRFALESLDDLDGGPGQDH